MTKATTNVARIAAAVAGLGLVAMSFAPAVGAQTMTTTTTTTSMSASFTRDLTIGARGADVSALQTWLLGNGFSIPAGATGYFGSQTKAAVAAFQAANGITPAVGYFGPITRAKLASMGAGSTSGGSVAGCAPGAAYSSTTGQPCTSSTGTTGLSGHEADLTNFSLQAGNDVAQGDTNQEIAVAKFNVRGGDVNVQRVTVNLIAAGSGSVLPWKYFSTLSVYSGSHKIGSADVSMKSDWSQGTGNNYSIDIPTNGIVKIGDNQELSIRADAVSTIDTANDSQTFTLDVPDNGIRAIDAAGLQEYTGKTSDTVTVGITSAQQGKLTITTDANNPAAGVIVVDTTTSTTGQDLLTFDVRNTQDVSVDLNTMAFTLHSGSSSVNSLVRKVTLDLDGHTYSGTVTNGNTTTGTVTFSDLNTSVGGNDSITGTLSVDLYGQTGHYAATGESLYATLANAGVDATNSDTGDTSTVSGSATGKSQTLGVNAGITVKAGSSTNTESYNSTNPANSTGSFALNFSVTANGNQDVYIPKTISAQATSTEDGSNGVSVDDVLGASTVGTTSASVSSSADTDPDNSGYYVVHAGATETFTANVTMDPSASGYYQIGLKDINFSVNSNGSNLQNLHLTPTDYESSQLYIHG